MQSLNLEKAREKLLSCSRPLFLFDDDADGLAAFLLLYRFVRSGKGMPLKGKALDEFFVQKVNTYQPDLIVILDKPVVDESFFKGVHAPILWLDHHKPQHPPSSVLYINPRKEDPEQNLPTSFLAYLIVLQDEWVATTGVVSDWEVVPDQLKDALEESYPDFLPRSISSPQTALYDSPAGQMARIFSFALKGRMSTVLTHMKILTRIKNPQELFKQEHAQARLLMKTVLKCQEEYDALKNQIAPVKDDPLLSFSYDASSTSYTTDLSNELLFLYPEKFIVIARLSGPSYKCSLRSTKHRVDEILDQALVQVNGTGGGHEHACGAVIREEDFSTFLDILRAKIQE